ncbi:MAG: NAD(P)H-hydrate dehydratase [Lachnospiraceae bacterium]|nr:NAD(P)H-hydrate dehydratase [Lachnospiraceae bacterium]
MRYLVTGAEMKRLDKNTMERIGIPSLVLMERAALESFYVLREKGLVKQNAFALILAGYGNNGGDGLALARMLCEAGVCVEVTLVGEEAKATDSWRAQKSILNAYPVSFVNTLEEKAYDFVVDALFGVGLSRNLSGEWLQAVEKANSLKGVKVALDVPSGVCSDDGRILGAAFVADFTITFGFEKIGLWLYPGCDCAGEIILKDVGISERAFLGTVPDCFTLEEDVSSLLPKRRRDGNKGTFGKALIVAGGFQMAGAAVLCAKACYGAGAGMVKVLTDPGNRVIVQQIMPEALFGSIDEAETIRDALEWCDVICIGPGLGKGENAAAALKIILEKVDERIIQKPLVLDADAINLISESEERINAVKEQARLGRTIILTPHLLEMLRLWNGLFVNEKMKLAQLKLAVREYAGRLSKEIGAIVVAKDARTFICADGRPACLNLSGNSGMATAGSGDVLAGMITAFLAQSKGAEADAFLLACKAVRYHGLMGENAARGKGEHGVMARDLIPQ